jgi:alpha-beta hydrolase superfamily lysophospholipase
MGFLFRDESFSFETLRAAGAAPYDGADLGEVLATTRLIREGDLNDWLTAWRATAERVHELARTSLAAGHRVSARQAFLRASNYYRTAEFFRRCSPIGDRLLLELSRRSREAFGEAIDLMDRPVERIAIPYDDIDLPGYLFRVDDAPTPRPLVIYTNGYDSTAEESWFAIAAAALQRGYHVLAYDGPGQGAVIRERGLPFRPDWEHVLGAVIDFAVKQPGVEPEAIAQFGYSMGAYLVARSAAFDHRSAALILDDGIFDMHQAYRNAIPAPVMKMILAGHSALPNRLMALKARAQTQVRWGLDNGVWTMGGPTYADFIRRTTAYTLEGIADRIIAPTLIMDAEDDQFLAGQPEVLQCAMTAPTTLARFTTAEGSGEHCHVGSLLRTHQVIFDWLDTTLAARQRVNAAPPVAPTQEQR